jgi:hypothetical protein
MVVLLGGEDCAIAALGDTRGTAIRTRRLANFIMRPLHGTWLSRRKGDERKTRELPG